MTSLPPETSARGDNSHVIKCEGVGQHRHYAVCLNFLNHYEADTLKENSFTDCLKACAHKQCAAIEMRQEERDKGEAIYYEKREQVKLHRQMIDKNPISRIKVNKSDPSYVKGWNQVGGSAKRDIPVDKPVRAPIERKQPVREDDEIVAMNMSDVVNAVAKADSVIATDKPASNKPMEGESPLEFALRMREQA